MFVILHTLDQPKECQSLSIRRNQLKSGSCKPILLGRVLLDSGPSGAENEIKMMNFSTARSSLRPKSPERCSLSLRERFSRHRKPAVSVGWRCKTALWDCPKRNRGRFHNRNRPRIYNVNQFLLLVNALVVCAALRTCLSVERTLCAWLRTSLSCLGHIL